MTTSFAQFRIPLLSIATVFGLSACATLPPPTNELAAAQQAVVRADGADADQYAAAEIAAARNALAQAQATMSKGRDADVRRLALFAAADADLAYAKSRDAVATAELAQRRAELDQLRRQLGTEGGR
ncbi:DUF4398 domain-containing protein [Lysobacter psychrotolerans]|uniref:DUF4398 domain-containing protein n=1 Tax=Montanilutibacter psychrotolerans TaxID=1327343 RepID=A0A3M8SSU8_9GAMM|nr:DUF4398 domain-containing protein [Lysobacter psychrotolerans]